MPNWCENSLQVTGPERVLAAWVTRVKSNLGSEIGLLETFCAPAYNEDKSNWWEAQTTAWDTKWDVPINELDITEHNGVVGMTFNTAWSPPLSWMNTMSRDWPSLTFNLAFEEGGMCFMGYSIMRDGDSYEAENEMIGYEFADDPTEQSRIEEAWHDAMSERRDQLMFEASDAYEKAMY
jgi:hypothetical protein